MAELLYAQKGARVEYLDGASSGKERILGLNYAEAPILIRIDITPNLDEKRYNRIELETGFSFAGLVQTSVEENLNRVNYSFTDASNEFKRNDINFIIGIQTEIFKNMKLGIRSSTALTKLYVNEEAVPAIRGQAQFGFTPPYNFFRNYHLSLYASYQIY